MALRINKTGVNRRRALSLFAAAAGLPILGPGRAYGAASALRWRGTALGAQASLTLYHWDRAEARRLIGLALAELARLEAIFSLYRPDSALTRLNLDGELRGPPIDLVRLLGQARRWSQRTQGAFDVTVQPLWRLLAMHFSQTGADPAGPPAEAVAAARALIDYRGVELAPGRIAFARPGMALTLNGIAQGYITDRVAELLRAEGLSNVLVDLGEIQALGHGGAGRPWRVGLADPGAPGTVLDTLQVTDRAVATSAATGPVLDPRGRTGHILNPPMGVTGTGFVSATVVARWAADADALSTALVSDAGVVDALPEMRHLEIDRVIGLDRNRALRRFNLA